MGLSTDQSSLSWSGAVAKAFLRLRKKKKNLSAVCFHHFPLTLLWLLIISPSVMSRSVSLCTQGQQPCLLDPGCWWVKRAEGVSGGFCILSHKDWALPHEPGAVSPTSPGYPVTWHLSSANTCSPSVTISLCLPPLIHPETYLNVQPQLAPPKLRETYTSFALILQCMLWLIKLSNILFLEHLKRVKVKVLAAWQHAWGVCVWSCSGTGWKHVWNSLKRFFYSCGEI